MFEVGQGRAGTVVVALGAVVGHAPVAGRLAVLSRQVLRLRFQPGEPPGARQAAYPLGAADADAEHQAQHAK